jgi:hypothetical protein
LCGVKSFLFNFGNDLLIRRIVYFTRSGKYPQVFSVGMTNYCVAVIIGQINDPVFAPEWPKELDFQFCIATVFNNECLAFDVGLLSGDAVFVTPVFNHYIALVCQGIFSSGAVTIFLKPLRK